ncbi:MAG: hypothetical protein GY906_37000 [bacterium]|nr:hypothetical protein [bacterium]
MGKRFAPDMAEVTAGFYMLDVAEYIFEIGKPKCIFYTKEDGTDVAGARLPLKVLGRVANDGSLEEIDGVTGKQTAPMRLYVHTEGAFGFTKQLILAAMGYSIREEKQANEEYFEGTDFSVDVNDDDEDNIEASLGASWAQLEGKKVRLTADKGINPASKEEQQEYRSYQPA